MKTVEVTMTMFVDWEGQRHELPEKALESDIGHFLEMSGGYSQMGCGEAAEIILRNRIAMMEMLNEANMIMRRYEAGEFNAGRD